MYRSLRFSIIGLFLVLAILSAFALTNIRFTFSLDQFFPEGDPDLEVYQEFNEAFESDINFLLIAIHREQGVFEQSFLEKVEDFTQKARHLPNIESSFSLTDFSYPIKTPFGITTIPAIHIDQPSRYSADKDRILSDERLVRNLIDEEGKSIVVALKTTGVLELEGSKATLEGLEALIKDYAFERFHLLGPAYFTNEMVKMQKREVAFSSVISGLLVTLAMFILFRRPWGIAIALTSIGLGLLLFMGLLAATGRELNAMAALYPVLMIIVGTSDVIHIMSKYIDELRKGKSKIDAIKVTIREIGLATLLTSLTTAIGFATLLTSKVTPIQDFGLNAAIGVGVAYLTVILFTTSVLSFFELDQLTRLKGDLNFWDSLMEKTYHFTLRNPNRIIIGSLLVLGISFYGISLITTNYTIGTNLPRGEKISEDFRYFERVLAGFRPIEVVVTAKGEKHIDDYEGIKSIDAIAGHMRTYPAIKTVQSPAMIYKSLNQMSHANLSEYYRLPESEKAFNKYKRFASKLPEDQVNVLLSKDKKTARITGRILDLGADSIKMISNRIDEFLLTSVDSSKLEVRQTGTGLILDKNAEYIRRSLLLGLGSAVIIIGLIMSLLFLNPKMVLISIIPNVFPLILAGAFLGFTGVELEAGVSIVFAVVFGIAVDDTIHFLSKYKLSRARGLDKESSLHITFRETGKAICLTSVILFFGFLVMLFSIHPPSVTIGLLISLTLLSAVIADLFVIPVLIRKIL